MSHVRPLFRPWVTALLVVAMLPGLQGCKKTRPLQDDGINLVRVVPGEDGQPRTVTVEGRTLLLAQWPTAEDPLVPAVVEVMGAQVGQDALTLLHHARVLTLARVGARDKEETSAVQRAVASSPVAVVLGAPEEWLGQGLALQDTPDGKPRVYPHVLWAPLSTADAAVEDGSLEQALPGKVARLALGTALHRAAQRTAGARASLRGHPGVVSDPLTALLDGFDLHVQAQARKHSKSGRLAGTSSVERARNPAEMRVAGVNTQRYVFRLPDPPERLRTDEARTAWLQGVEKGRPPAKGALWNGAQMVCVPGVVAAALNNLVEDPEAALSVPAPEFFGPMLGGKVPADFKPQALSTLLLAHLKLIHVVQERLNRPDAVPMPGVNVMLEAYGAEFPAEKKAAQRALLQATMARSASNAGTSGVEGGGAVLRLTREVLDGQSFADGAVGPPLMVSLKDATLHGVDGRVGPLTFNLNAALMWQLELIPGFLREDAERLAARVEKTPLTDVDTLSGTIPAESFAALHAGAIEPK